MSYFNYGSHVPPLAKLTIYLPQISMEKASELLTEDGALALFWYWQDAKESELLKRIIELLCVYLGTIEKARIGFGNRHSQFYFEELQKRCNVVVRKEFAQTVSFTKARHHDFMMTFSLIQKLPEEKKNNFSEELKQLYDSFAEPLSFLFKFALVMGKNNEMPG